MHFSFCTYFVGLYTLNMHCVSLVISHLFISIAFFSASVSLYVAHSSLPRTILAVYKNYVFNQGVCFLFSYSVIYPFFDIMSAHHEVFVYPTTHIQKCILSLSFSSPLSVCLSLSRSPSHTHTETHTQIHALVSAHTHALACTQTHMHTDSQLCPSHS